MVARCRAISSLVFCLCNKVGDPGDTVKRIRLIAIVCTHAQVYTIFVQNILMHRHYPFWVLPHRRIFPEGHRRVVAQ
jgi:hypothetical protein